MNKNFFGYFSDCRLLKKCVIELNEQIKPAVLSNNKFDKHMLRK